MTQNENGRALNAERLDRLRAWEVDLNFLIAEAERAGDEAVRDSAKAMLVQCRQFISEAERSGPS